VVDHLRDWMLHGECDDDLLAEDVVVEWPFAAPGRPRRLAGREAFRALAGPARAALPFHFDEFDLGAVHETADPDVVVLEYRLGGTVTTTGQRRSAAFISVIRVRDGRIVLWREYQDTAAIAAALTASPDP
jgi:ketosteroid isomerase-like protein